MRYFTQLLSFSALSVGLIAPTGFAQPNEPQVVPQAVAPPRLPPAPKPRAGTPEQQIKDDLKAFIDNMNTSDSFFHVQKFVAGARVGLFGGNEWFKNWMIDRNGTQITLNEITVGKIENGTATANVSLGVKRIYMQADGKQETDTKLFSENLTLKFGAIRYEYGKAEQSWQIVPPTKNPVLVGAEPGVLETITYQLAQNNWTYPDSTAQSSLRRLKQLSLSAMQYAQDYEECYAFAPEYIQEALMPYSKSRQIFQIPNTQDQYTFNGWLSGKTLNQIPAPHRVVMFYEGDSEQPIFRYADKAAIGFADGHCVLVTREEAKDLIWKP